MRVLLPAALASVLFGFVLARVRVRVRVRVEVGMHVRCANKASEE